MTVTKNPQVVNLQVTEGLTVAVFQNQSHEFVMPVRDVALGYGVASGTIRNQLSKNFDEFIEGRHYIKGVAFCGCGLIKD